MPAFARLSFSLLVSSAVFLASAALNLPVQSSQPELLAPAPAKLASAALPNQPSPPDLLVLAPENFDFAIAQGVWFIEHTSPYCYHCRAFAPTWAQLVEANDKKADSGIHLAQINCAVHGHLCQQNNVIGYPQMNLYKDGKFVETFKQARSFDILTNYLAAHAEPLNRPVPEPTDEDSAFPVASDKDEFDEQTVSRQDFNPFGTVLVLDENNFQETIDKGNVFVKFFAPWCGHCKKLAPTWTQLAGQMQHKINVAEVDCQAHGALCHTQGITGYPMLRFYGGMGTKTEYTGARKLEEFVAFVEKVSEPSNPPAYEPMVDQTVL